MCRMSTCQYKYASMLSACNKKPGQDWFHFHPSNQPTGPVVLKGEVITLDLIYWQTCLNRLAWACAGQGIQQTMYALISFSECATHSRDNLHGTGT